MLFQNYLIKINRLNFSVPYKLNFHWNLWFINEIDFLLDPMKKYSHDRAKGQCSQFIVVIKIVAYFFRATSGILVFAQKYVSARNKEGEYITLNFLIMLWIWVRLPVWNTKHFIWMQCVICLSIGVIETIYKNDLNICILKLSMFNDNIAPYIVFWTTTTFLCFLVWYSVIIPYNKIKLLCLLNEEYITTPQLLSLKKIV